MWKNIVSNTLIYTLEVPLKDALRDNDVVKDALKDDDMVKEAVKDDEVVKDALDALMDALDALAPDTRLLLLLRLE